MKIFLDDFRSPTVSMKGFNIVRSYEACVRLLDVFRNDLEMIDLDYDLGGKLTGLDVLEYMKSEDIVPKHINIHSDHEQGLPSMMRYAEKHFPDTTITANRVT